MSEDMKKIESDNTELYEKLCDVIENTPHTPLQAIAAAKGLLATLVSAYEDVYGEDVIRQVFLSVLDDIKTMREAESDEPTRS